MRRSTTMNGGSLTALALGAAAGAAGTTALNAASYVDMTIRARPPSTTPQDTAAALAAVTHINVPGTETVRSNRLAGLGPLLGITTGVGVGAVVGLVMSMGWPTRRSALGVVATAGAMIAANAPMTLLRVSDPTTWTAGDWATDVVPHLAYGATVAAVLHRFATNR